MSKKNSNVLNLKKIIEKDKEIFKTFLLLKNKLIKFKKKTLVVAVSGGPDSLALAGLSRALQKEKKNKYFFVLVDHGIRKNSSKEAELVKKILKKHKISLSILRNKEKITKNFQSKAREIRYDLIQSFCKKKRANYILTGHHSDDQIETFLIRLSRGSGIQGLSAMRFETKLKNRIALLRPLLETKKENLIYIAKKLFGRIVKDPSNNDKKYLRTRIRKLKKNLEKSGIHHNQILRSISNLASTNTTLNTYFEKTYKKIVSKHNKKLLINLENLFLESSDIQLKVLSKSMKDFSKSYYPPRSKKVLNLIKQLKLNKISKFTLSKCILQKSKDYLTIKKET